MIFNYWGCMNQFKIEILFTVEREIRTNGPMAF